MLQPKPISKAAAPAALEKALRYRLLNEPAEAESICHDVLGVEPENQQALVMLLLALTDQFETKFAVSLRAAKGILPRLRSEYEREYYEGIIYERWAKAHTARGLPGEAASNWFREALHCFERAQVLSQPDDPDAILRWNACVRALEQHAETTPQSRSLTDDATAGFGDDTAVR